MNQNRADVRAPSYMECMCGYVHARILTTRARHSCCSHVAPTASLAILILIRFPGTVILGDFSMW